MDDAEVYRLIAFIRSLFEHIKIYVFDGIDNIAVDVRDTQGFALNLAISK